MYYGYINDSKTIESLPLGEIISLPKDCGKITNINNVFHIIYDIYSGYNVTKDGYLLQLSLAESHPKFKINKITKEIHASKDFSDDIWLANYVMVEQIFPLNNLSTFMHLIDLGADCNSESLLTWACVNNNLDLVKYLHQHNVYIEDERDELFYASEYGNNDIIKYLSEDIDRFKKSAEKKYFYWFTRNRYYEINLVNNLFIKNNIKPDFKLLRFKENLEWCCIRGYSELGMDMFNFIKIYEEYLDLDYNQLFCFVCYGGSVTLLKEVLKNYYPNQITLDECLSYSVTYSNINIIKYLIDLGANLDDPNEYIKIVCSEYNSTANSNKIETFKFLMENGADISYWNNYAISLAIKDKNFEIVELLLDKGVDPFCRDNYVLKYAVFYDNINIVKKLIQMGVDPLIYQDYLLAFCSQQGCFITLKYLLELGLRTGDQTIIYRAIERNHEDCFRILIQTTNNFDNDQILNFCVKNNHLQFIIILLELYNDIIITEDILITAYQNKFFDIIELLLNRCTCYDSLELMICNAVLKNQILLSQDLLSCNNLMNDLHILHFVINKGDKSLVKYLMENNHDRNYSSWTLIYCLYNYETMKFLLENFKFDEEDIAHAKICAGIIGSWSVYTLLQLYDTNYNVEFPSLKFDEYLSVYDYYPEKGMYFKKSPKYQYEDISPDSISS
ncbi:ankyrin repeat protein [Moumouvirus australiensis]|uniref:Ankyrin repeat protein n=1 Tax=Moumouvirus australiensis TaxID=2109587 RepID=A0A2P1EKW3_9VIRU|nr:ankyrin repeat protein [Moumouvirus australiensis]AVL94538.1 ankyrin repeat protein [Moumouvirus australiensis]